MVFIDEDIDIIDEKTFCDCIRQPQTTSIINIGYKWSKRLQKLFSNSNVGTSNTIIRIYMVKEREQIYQLTK